MPKVLLVIDTENYSGNFEREICAYATGQVNEHSRSDHDRVAEGSAMYIKHIDWWNTHIRYVHHEEYDDVVAQIWPTEGWYNNGLGGHYRDDGTQDAEAIAASLAYAKDHYGKENLIHQARIDNNNYDLKLGWTKEACERAIARNNQAIEDAGKIVRKWPAYMSVAISVDSEPPAEVMEEFKDRVKYFCDHDGKTNMTQKNTITLTGFRVITQQ